MAAFVEDIVYQVIVYKEYKVVELEHRLAVVQVGALVLVQELVEEPPLEHIEELELVLVEELALELFVADYTFVEVVDK